MRILRYTDPEFASSREELCRRAVPERGVREVVESILEEVRTRGDAALVEYAKKFDGATMVSEELRVTAEEFEEAGRMVGEEARELVAAALENVRAFAKRSLRADWSATNAQGAEVGEVFQAFERVGVYIPGGTAPLVSTAVMTAGFAAAAGVPEIVACTPCGSDLKVNAALLYALRSCGVSEVYKVGGAQAVAALAYGTASIPPVAKIFGPGNRYVVEAKRQVVGAVAIDLLPGPSEVMVLADGSARAAWVAADLLAQAEHGGDSLVVLVTESEELAEEVLREIGVQSANLGRQRAIQGVLADGFTVVVVKDLGMGIEVANGYAPEHLSLVVENEAEWLPRVKTAGAIFVGGYSPIAAGDFLAGPSHVLPTGGAGKSFPGLTADQFQRRTSVVRYDAGSLARSVPLIEGLSALEGLDAHGRSASIRLE